MPFISANLDDVSEDKPVPEGEYELTIQSWKEERSKAGNKMLTVIIKINDADAPGASNIFHRLVLPNEETDREKARMMLLNLKRFLHVFGIPNDRGGFDPEDFNGATGRCLVGQREYEGQVSNELRLPRLRS